MRIIRTQTGDNMNVLYNHKNNPEIMHEFSTDTRNVEMKNTLHLNADIVLHTIHSPNNNSSLYI